jgi:hypothetical protein
VARSVADSRIKGVASGEAQLLSWLLFKVWSLDVEIYGLEGGRSFGLEVILKSLSAILDVISGI